MSAQHPCLDGKQQGLDAQQHGVHQSNGVDDMQREGRAAAQLLDRPDVKMLATEADEKVCNIVHLIYNAKNYEGIAKDFPKAQRKYDGVTLYFTKMFSQGWIAQTSYTVSWLRDDRVLGVAGE